MSTATGVQTNGIGKVTTSHLNLTRTMADAVAADVERKDRASTQTAARRESHSPKAHYAGAPR